MCRTLEGEFRCISYLVGSKHFIIDTSRNGLGPAPDGSWCNPPGRALGPKPTADTGFPLVDAFYWMNSPGHSDGECGNFLSAGTWVPEYAFGLARRLPTERGSVLDARRALAEVLG